MAERTIKHGYYWYHSPETQIIGGKEEERLVERTAFFGQTVDIPRTEDVERGESVGAFYTDAELARIERGDSGEEVEEVAVSDLDHGEMVDWLTGTGMFDSQPKPKVDEVLEAASGDPDLARRLLDAENEATGSNPRAGVEQGLTKIVQEG